ncbi:ABC transporter ATP-binding protein [Desulfuromonas acetoxidans]|uniref:ABC transporter ATP-binding protein n=1 Tax=Desulfuromonas acetoxidans TaxID=891 RepID=UPI000CB4A418|nr:ABC transporter ATP-binding protein [Desulfuromonas acetoxidans]MBF0644687.1 ABC transporter ATP-binding protein [Desulfuromonas acetoxidans]NVE15897.1 ABC transporter ATP-binding protein [Desulfuromonas acetoxidans]PLX95272.1 MAG: ABC transporter ATP-binding protein [Desulfuromonas sp.]
MIQAEHLSKKYTGHLGRKPTLALSDVSLHVKEKEIFGIVGPNGAGKSTLLKILLGLVKASSGIASLNGVSVSEIRSRQQLGYLPENPCLYDSLSVVDHLNFIARLYQLPKDLLSKRMDDVLTRVGLDDVAHRSLRTYSKGMVQRAALACALFTEPDLLILDEPMSGLDPLGRKMVLDIIREYNSRGNTVLFCSHVLNDVERICDRIAIMNKGKLVVTVTPQQLQQEEGDSPLESLFMRTVLEEGSA